MLDNDEQSGMVGMLVGIIVLVFVGIFLSLMMDKRFSFTKKGNSLVELIAEEKVLFDETTSELARTREKWVREYEPLLGQGASLKELQDSSQDRERRIEALQEERAAVLAGLDAAVDTYSEYQGRYRQQVRSDAAGEKHPELVSLDGRIFRNVTIGRVWAAGIDIRHSEGTLRLLPNELPPSWQERFQWKEEEVVGQLEKERARQHQHDQFVDQKAKAASTPLPPVKAEPSVKKGKIPANQPDPEVEGLRQAVADARQRLQQARSEASRARSEAASSKGRSVPGSLETWAERAQRMEAASAKLHSQYMSARGKLATIAPNDAQLQIQD